MGKASSAKKVARAAGLGGSRNYASRPAWNYYAAVFILLVLGVVGVFNSREYLDAKTTKAGTVPPTVGTSWFEGYAVDECGKLLPTLKPSHNSDGINAKDGVIYIQPKTKSAAGKNATLAKFAASVGITLNAGELQVPGSRLYTNGDTCEGKPGQVYVMTWASPEEPQSDGILQDKDQVSSSTGLEDTCNPDCDGGVLLENDQLVTIAFLPPPPKKQTLVVLQPPPTVVAQLTKIVSTGGTTTTTAAPPATTTPKVTPTTTGKGAGTSTTTATPTTTATTAKAATPKAKPKTKAPTATTTK
jgi:hypothetical protein